MAITFGIAAIVFALLAPLSAAGAPSDHRAAPYCMAASFGFMLASVAYGVLVH